MAFTAEQNTTPDSQRSGQTLETHTVTFFPGEIVVGGVPAGETLLRAAARADFFLPSPCAGAGSCGRCIVRIKSGSVKAEPTAKITAAEWDLGMRLACVSRVVGDVVVELPEATALAGRRQTGVVPAGLMRGRYLEAADTSGLIRPEDIDPPIRLVPVTLTPPTATDRMSDVSRFQAALRERLGSPEIEVPVSVAQTLPQKLRASDWRVTAVVRSVAAPYEKWEVTRVKSADELAPSYLAVVDLGTTTVWGRLLDCRSGRVLATAAAFNYQIQYGDDVISRMVRARESGGKDRMQSAAVASISEVLENLAYESGVAPGGIDYLVVAGNTTMTSLFLKVETHHLRVEPYVPPFDSLPPVAAETVGLGSALAAGAVVQTLPAVASYVGGDIVAGVLASGIADGEEVCLYLDVGTNGEAVIGNKEWLLTTSCSAGSAFEGGGLRNGMCALSGAIESVIIDPESMETSILTIDDAPPLGICGSGVIDAVAGLLKAGILSANGKFDPSSGAAGLRESEGRCEFVLVPAEFSGTGADIVLTEPDIDNVIRAKAAMFAGVTTLLRTVSLEWSDLQRIVVAGAFGKHIRVAEAMIIGLFPELDLDRFEFLGNGSLLGAQAVAVSRRMGARAVEVAALMNNIELTDNSSFQEEYMAAMFLPHTDMERFPTVGRLLGGR